MITLNDYVDDDDNFIGIKKPDKDRQKKRKKEKKMLRSCGMKMIFPIPSSAYI